MADQITPKSLNIHSRTERPRADARLEIAGEKNTVLGNALYQVNWIVRTGRLNGTAEMAVRALSGYQFAKLVCHVANEGLLDSAITRYIYVFLGMDNDTPPAVEPQPEAVKEVPAMASTKLNENQTAALRQIWKRPNHCISFALWSVHSATKRKLEANGYVRWNTKTFEYELTLTGLALAKSLFAPDPDDTPPAVQPETTEAEAPVDYNPPVYSDFEMIDPGEDYDSYIARKERDSLVNPDNAHIGTWDYDDAVTSPDPEPPAPSHTTVPRTSPAPTITGHGRSAKQPKQARPRTRRGARQHANMQHTINSRYVLEWSSKSRKHLLVLEPARPVVNRQNYFLPMAQSQMQPIFTARLVRNPEGEQTYCTLTSWQHVRPANPVAAIVARELAAKEVDLTAAFRAVYRNAPKRLGGKAA